MPESTSKTGPQSASESGFQGLIVLDPCQPESAQSLLPRPAVLASSGWGDIYLELHQQPRFSTAEHQHVLHAIALGLPDAANNICALGSRWLDGKRCLEQRPAGGIAVIPAGASHRCSWESEGRFMVLALEPSLLGQVGQDWVDPDRIELKPHFMDEPDEFIQRVLLTLQAEAQTTGIGGPLLVDSLKTALVVHLLRRYCATQPRLASYSAGLSAAKLRQVKDYIDVHLDQDLKLVDLAELVQMSPPYFARLFKQSEGTTPHQYILQSRIRRAQFLLRHSDLSMAEIALSAGFCDQSHLTRCFKRALGVTPTQFREA